MLEDIVVERDGNSMIEPRPARLLLSGKELARIRAMAIRRGNWYRSLGNTERALFDLTIRVVRQIRSSVLNRILASIISKLHISAKCGFAISLHKLGKPLAEKISKIAHRWGNTYADSWSADDDFARFLAIMHINDHMSFTEEGNGA